MPGGGSAKVIEMTNIQIGVASKIQVLTVLTGLNSGNIDDVIGHFADEFRFNDYGSGLQFHQKDRLAEFFQKARKLYPDSFVNVMTVIGNDDNVFAEWILQATITEPLYGGLTRKIPISVHGASIIRTANGKITDWSDYYDGPSARRADLASHFAE